MKQERPTLYIMVGLPFSGKSTLAKSIASYTGNSLVGFDKVWEEEQSKLSIQMSKVDEWKHVLQACHGKIRKFLSEGKSVIYDDTNTKKEHRDVLRKIAQDCSAEVKIIFVDTSLEEIKARQIKNKASQERHDVTSDNFQNALSQIEPPTDEGTVLKFQPSDNTQEWMKRLKINIRLATPEDASGIARVHVKTWQCAYKGQIPDSYLDSLSVTKRTETWKQALENPDKGVNAFVAEVDNEVIGWCTAGTNRDEDATKELGELHGIYIDPEYINKGVGSQLMEHALNKLRQEGYKKATLWVLDTNEKTRKFYEKKGWTIEGIIKDEIREGFTLYEVRYIISL